MASNKFSSRPLQLLQKLTRAQSLGDKFQRPIGKKLRSAMRRHKSSQLYGIDRRILPELDADQIALALNRRHTGVHRLQSQSRIAQELLHW